MRRNLGNDTLLWSLDANVWQPQKGNLNVRESPKVPDAEPDSRDAYGRFCGE